MVLREKGCIRLNYPVTPGLKLGSENHLALRLKEEKKKRRMAKKQFRAERVRRCLIRTTSWYAACPQDRPAYVTTRLLYV